jgi:hypothetical protein
VPYLFATAKFAQLVWTRAKAGIRAILSIWALVAASPGFALNAIQPIFARSPVQSGHANDEVATAPFTLLPGGSNWTCVKMHKIPSSNF